MYTSNSGMHARNGRALTRSIVTALLLLAVSPVTAPFLTFDLKDWLGDSTSPGVALVQPKTTHDEPVSTVVSGSACLLLRAVIAPATVTAVYRVSRTVAFLPPLRI
jgi:hypothetical protein